MLPLCTVHIHRRSLLPIYGVTDIQLLDVDIESFVVLGDAMGVAASPLILAYLYTSLAAHRSACRIHLYCIISKAGKR